MMDFCNSSHQKQDTRVIVFMIKRCKLINKCYPHTLLSADKQLFDLTLGTSRLNALNYNSLY